MKKFFRGISKINKSMFWAMSVLIIFMSLMVAYDVIARYVFRHPTSFGYDLSLWLTVVLAFIGGGYAIQTKEHIVVDVAFGRFSPKTKAIVNVISGVFMLILAYVLIRYGMGLVMTYFKRGSVAMSGFNIPIWIKWLVVPLGGILLCLQAIVYMGENIYFLISGQQLDLQEDKK